jgi:hypothetical protein
VHISPKAAATRLTRTRRVGLFAAALAVPALIASGLTPGAEAAPAPSGAADEAVVQFQVRATPGTTSSELAEQLLLDGYDVYGGSAGVLFVHAPASAADPLGARGDLEIVAQNTVAMDFDQVEPASQDAILPARLDGGGYETYYGGYRTHDAYQEFTNDLKDAYPELVQLINYGETWTGDNSLRAVCVTADALDGCQLTPDVDKARFLLIGQIHARELTTGEVAWRMLSHLTDEYGKDAGVTQLLDDTEFWIVPHVNPDGIELHEIGITEDGTGGLSDAWQRKNLNDDLGTCTGGSSSQYGVDLNRNFDSNWGGAGTSPIPCNLTYKGESAASEPETDAMQELIKDLFEDQRGGGASDPAPPDTRGSMISMHSYSNLVLFPYGDVRHTPNDAGLRSMGFRMSDYNGYNTGEPDEILYQVSGSTDDYAYEKLGIASFTYEIGPASGTCGGFFPAFSCQDMFWDLNRDAILYAAAATQQPYTMSLGPTTSNAKAKNKGTGKAVVKAVADDDAYGDLGVNRPASQNVTAGRIYLDAAPWEGGTAKTMTVVGSGKQVDLKTTVKRAAQKRYAYIQARDSQGNWGPVETVWIKAKG